MFAGDARADDAGGVGEIQDGAHGHFEAGEPAGRGVHLGAEAQADERRGDAQHQLDDRHVAIGLQRGPGDVGQHDAGAGEADGQAPKGVDVVGRATDGVAGDPARHGGRDAQNQTERKGHVFKGHEILQILSQTILAPEFIIALYI